MAAVARHLTPYALTANDVMNAVIPIDTMNGLQLQQSLARMTNLEDLEQLAAAVLMNSSY